MLKPLLFAVALAIASTAATAGTRINGTHLNGVNVNGTHLNGVNVNGIRPNGVRFNGVKQNGVRYNGDRVGGLEAAVRQPAPSGLTVLRVRLP